MGYCTYQFTFLDNWTTTHTLYDTATQFDKSFIGHSIQNTFWLILFLFACLYYFYIVISRFTRKRRRNYLSLSWFYAFVRRYANLFKTRCIACILSENTLCFVCIDTSKFNFLDRKSVV